MGRYPVDIFGRFKHLVSNLADGYEPAVAGKIHQRRVAAPAEWVGVLGVFGGENSLFTGQIGDDIAVGLFEEEADRLLRPENQMTAAINALNKRQVFV